MKEEKEQYENLLVLEEDRYNNLLEICRKYKEQQGKDITPKEYILMLIDSALGNK
ncbi:MAG: hypothetical protein M3P08_04325 [Thermoproteota archaeon]|jgi:hypothetical protein|nr:hypothetical protein [Thermoproteota archaeon]